MNEVLSIIIVNWNTRDILGECLKSLHSIDWKDIGIGCEIIVVDNASTDNSVEMVKKNFPEVKVIASSSNIGFGAAVNKAAEAASGTLYLISNADVIYSISPIKAMLSTLNPDSTISAVAPKLVDKSGNKQPSSFRFPTLKRLALEQIFSYGNFGEIYQEENSTELRIEDRRYVEVDWVLGACFMIKSEIFHEVKGFCEEFFLYSEEIDLFYRIKKKGGKVCYLPEISVIHVGRASSSQVFEKMLLLQTKSSILYFTKNHGKIQGGIAKTVIIIGQSMRFCFFRVLSIAYNKKHEYRKKSDNYLYLIKGLISPEKRA